MPTAGECSSSPELAEKWGWDCLTQIVAPDGRIMADKVLREAYAGGEMIRWFRHPRKFIPPSINAWFYDFDYYPEGTYAIVPSHERHACWVECLNIYTYYLREFSRGRDN